ncbi:MAG: glycine zipper 2TM domain-containing protein [Aeromicrobium sp.]|nr:glycine zipper 2TM domain-containing protein [Burkholderiales bacterium]
MKPKLVIAASALLSSVMLAGCVSPGMGGGDYNRRQVRGEMNVRLGVVETVRDVSIDARGAESGTSTLVGAGLGGIAGSTMGGGSRANAAGAIAGAVVGGLIGNAVEKRSNDRRGVEVTVRLEGGKLVAVTQENDEDFRVGDRVRILSGQGVTRVTRG